MDNQKAALNNISRAITKTVMLGEKTPCIQILNASCPPEGLTLQDIKKRIENGDKEQIKVWSLSEVDVKAKISKIANN